MKGPSVAAGHHLSQSLLDLGTELRRFKTGRLPVNKRSIDFSVMEEQTGEEITLFPYEPGLKRDHQVSCH